LDGGADFSRLSPNIVDGIWIYHAEPNVPYFASRFFLPLQPKNFEAIGSILCDVDTVNGMHTFYAALVSAAAGEDLSALFTDTYHFPLDQSLFGKAYSTFSAIIGCTECQTLILLSSFTANSKSGEVILNWATESEIDNAGFNIYRAASEGEAYVKINDALIPAKGSTTVGATYDFVDEGLQNRKTYYYKLEDIDLNGKSTMHGPVSAKSRLLYGLFQ